MAEKFNCFAHGAKACTVLKEKICKKGQCSFYKTKEEFAKDDFNAKLKLQAKYGK